LGIIVFLPWSIYGGGFGICETTLESLAKMLDLKLNKEKFKVEMAWRALLVDYSGIFRFVCISHPLVINGEADSCRAFTLSIPDYLLGWRWQGFAQNMNL